MTAKLKFLSAFAVILFSGATMNAQKDVELVQDNYDEGFRLGFGISPGYLLAPKNTQADGEFALGADIRLQYDLSKRTSLTLTTGYQHFFTGEKYNTVILFQPVTIKTKDLSLIPLKAGFKAFFWEDQFYALGEAGVGFQVGGPKFDDTNVILSPGIGWASKYIDLSLRYEHYTAFETGQLALRLAYGFKL